MRTYMTVSDVFAGYEAEYGHLISEAIRALLETKHLYQSVIVHDKDFDSDFWPRVEESVQEHFGESDSFHLNGKENPWIPIEDYGMVPLALKRPNAPSHIRFALPHAKIFCNNCNRVEAFNPVAAGTDVQWSQYPHRDDAREQVYTLSLLCQSCKLFPEVFLIRRTGSKLTLSGRSPMEHVTVPPEIPKAIQKYYSGAIIAFQSGQTLAALFLMRTACEQVARQSAHPMDRADVAIDKYMADMHPNVREQFPSLRDIYGELSIDIHSATGSSELFERSVDKLGLHFRARQLYETPVRGPNPVRRRNDSDRPA